jgi:DNA-binding GntR family transcriptional regulator
MPDRVPKSSAVLQPRYAGVEETLRRRISKGTYRRGDSLPSETRLAEEFSVSRFTVREALRRLSDAGLISRQQGARSSVTGTEPSAYTFSVGSAEDLMRYASDTYLDILEMEQITVRAPLARFLCCREQKEWLLLTGVRRDASDDRIVGYTEVYLWAEFADRISDITVRGRPIHQQIEDEFHITVTNIRQDIDAIPMPDKAAGVLECEPGSPALEIVRRYFVTRGRAFQVARNLHIAGAFTYTQDFQRREVAAE